MEVENHTESIPATTELSKSIRGINRDTVHKICSGQVVLNLAIAVKELIENAIDAGATSVEVRLKEYGSEQIQVIDNGSGVEECNFAALTLKHHTSKLREFSDLASVSTLGFRGEALSSLCALSDLTVLTRHVSTEVGTKITYDHNGHIVSKTPCARQIGTTVLLSNLFASLPVRHKEFTKNLKREFSKMCQLLYAYCLVAEGVRIQCTNETKKGARSTVVSTQGCNNIRENIVCVFGHKQLTSLIKISLHEPDKQILEEYGISCDELQLPFAFDGLISKCSHGSGRSASDRQYYYINSRPCEPTNIIKTVNEVYRHFNGNQYPFVFLNITAEQSQIDVNVTPDKRHIFMEKEKLLLATLKTSLLEMFKDFPSTFKMQNIGFQESNSTKDDKKNVSEVLKQWTKSNDKVLSQNSQPNTRGQKRNTTSPKGIMNYIYEKRMKIDEDKIENLSEHSGDSEDEEKLVDKFVKESYNSSDSEPDFSPPKSKINDDLKTDVFQKQAYKITIENPKPIHNFLPSKETVSCKSETRNEKLVTADEFVGENFEHSLFENIVKPEISNGLRNSKSIHSTVDDIRNIINQINVAKKISDKNPTVVKFRSEITSENAEQELQKQISKDMFERMSVIGQFNKGFIIAKLDSDMFIIDQHATDEKYHFETLQRTTVLENQKLVNPKPLELTVANELLLIENLQVFQKNGFSFNINENAEPRKKVSLTAIPVSKNYQFGKEDIEELLFMLQEDCSTRNCRPSRVRAMFASRACRKSVMVGSALSRGDMRRLLDHMAQIDQPWNCPHGRPTMRHLINLDLIHEK